MGEETTRKAEAAEQQAPDSDPGKAGASSPAGEDLEQIRRKAEERDLFLDELLRARADLDNYRKMVKRDRPGWEAQAVRGLIRELLPVVDNFERALESCAAGSAAGGLEEGIRLIYGMLKRFLETHGVREIEALDRPFDPQFHHAVQQVVLPDPARDGAVVEVLEKGYTHGGIVIRPTQVVVAKAIASDHGAGASGAAPGDGPGARPGDGSRDASGDRSKGNRKGDGGE